MASENDYVIFGPGVDSALVTLYKYSTFCQKAVFSNLFSVLTKCILKFKQIEAGGYMWGYIDMSGRKAPNPRSKILQDCLLAARPRIGRFI